MEMQWLGLDRFEPQISRFKEQEEEDAFCTRLLNIGGKWWPNEQRAGLVWSISNGVTSGIEDETEEEMRQLWVGYAKSGGVLFLETQSQIGDNKIPEDIGRLRMALTMEERCGLLRMWFGAVHYNDPQEYPGFANQHEMVFRDRSAS